MATLAQSPRPLAGKCALITGSSAGLGYTIADGLASAGCNVALHGAAFHLVRLALPGMRARSWGRIIKMTSVYGERGTVNRVDCGRFVRPEDVAAAVTFLCSPAARDITGSVLPVDGGWLAS